jgi:hypothetical protein
VQDHKYFYKPVEVLSMDEETLKTFKLKFIKLAVMLNVIVIVAAFAVIAFFKLGPGLNIPAAVALAAAAFVLSLWFRRSYLAEKAWLAEQD